MPDAACQAARPSDEDGLASGRTAAASRNGTVLLVDPDAAGSASCRRTLEDSGYDVVVTRSALALPGLLESVAPDAIVLDLAACDPAGRSAWAHHLASTPSAREIPLVIVAAPGMELDPVAALGAAIEACLIKPVAPDELLRRVEHAVRAHRRRLVTPNLRELRGEQARMWNVLLDFTRMVGRSLDLDEILERIVLAAAEITCSRRVSLMLPDERREHLRIAHAIGVDEEVRASVCLPIGDAIAGRAFTTGRRCTATNAPAGMRGDPPYDGESFVSMPILASTTLAHESVGVLNITHRFGDRPFEEHELEFIDLLGGIAGSVIDDALWRIARESLVKFECDLQVARRIQQNTFPTRLAVIDGFELDAWSEPADETGGDIYDIIGYRRDEDGGKIVLPTDEVDRVVLLLADATGHGVGPALSVTQVRAMLRMAVRMGTDLARILMHMNEQLCADLLRGRFITAWLGELNAADGRLTCFSAGQGPILVYEREQDAVRTLTADTVPLGILPDLEVTIGPPLPMRPGDVVAVISDGVFEATDSTGAPFGVDRAADVIRRHGHEPADAIILALREAVAAFVGDAPAQDDRTALIVKRTR